MGTRHDELVVIWCPTDGESAPLYRTDAEAVMPGMEICGCGPHELRPFTGKVGRREARQVGKDYVAAFGGVKR